MKRVLFGALVACFLTLGLATPAFAGSPHFVGDPVLTVDGNSLTVSGKIAGLGNEEQVDVQVSGTAECVNRGNNKPSAANKDDVAANGTFPVQNGKALFELTATASFQPECSPPMSVVFSDVTVSVPNHGLSFSF
jgi:hypothetical protein